MSVQGVTALIGSIAALVTALAALVHSIQTRKQIPK